MFDFLIGRLDKIIAFHCQRRKSTRTTSDECPKLLPISDNVSVVIQDTVQHFSFFLENRIARTFHGS